MSVRSVSVLFNKWPLFSRVFFVVFGVVLTLIASIAATLGEVFAAGVMVLVSLVLASLYFLENRVLIDTERRAVLIHFRWFWWRSERCIPLANIAQVYLRSLGKGGRELGLRLSDGAELSLCQPMGYESDRQALAKEMADRLGVPVMQIPLSDGPVTNGQLVVMNLVLHAFGAVWGFVAWLAATRPSTDGRMAWPVVWICGAVAALTVGNAWFRTIKEMRRRRRG